MSKDHLPPLFQAIASKNLEEVEKELLRNPDQTYVYNHTNFSPLEWSAVCGNSEIAKLLLKTKPYPNLLKLAEIAWDFKQFGVLQVIIENLSLNKETDLFSLSSKQKTVANKQDKDLLYYEGKALSLNKEIDLSSFLTGKKSISLKEILQSAPVSTPEKVLSSTNVQTEYKGDFAHRRELKGFLGPNHEKIESFYDLDYLYPLVVKFFLNQNPEVLTQLWNFWDNEFYRPIKLTKLIVEEYVKIPNNIYKPIKYDHFTVWDLAFRISSLKLIKLLIDKKGDVEGSLAKINYRDWYYYSKYSENKIIKIIEYLVDNKADVNFKDQQKYSTYYPLLNAVDYSEKSLSIVKLMLGLKADANVIGESGIGGYYNAFTRAIYNNNSCELLKLLISYGGDLKSHYYNSFEVLVTYSGNIETLKFFVEYFKQDQEIFPKLIKYFRTDSVDKAKYFLSQVDNPKKYEFDLLSHNYGFATFSDNCFPSLVFKDEDVWRVKKEIFNLMIEDYGFDINAKDEYGNSLLFSQIIYDNIEIDTASKYHTLRKNCLQLIIDLKADIDAANSKGQTILEHLTEYNISHIRFEKLKFLIKNKANLSVNGYKAAIKMFAKIDTLGIKDLFRKKVDDLNTPDKNDRTFLDVILMQFFKDITFEEFSQLQKNVVSKHLKNLIYVDNLVKLIQIGLKPNKMFAIEISKQNDKDLADEDKTYFNFNQDQKNFNNKMLAKGVFYDSPTTPSDNNNNDTKIDFSGNLNDDDNAIL